MGGKTRPQSTLVQCKISAGRSAMEDLRSNSGKLPQKDIKLDSKEEPRKLKDTYL